MAVANPCLQKNWGDWKSEMEDNRRERWREGVSCWADVEVSDGGEEKRECEEVEEDVVSEEKEVSNEERENEREKEAEIDMKEKESKEYEVDGKEIKMDEDKEEGENEIQWTLMGSEEVVGQEDDVKTKGEEKENENGVDMVNINGEVEEKKVIEGVMDKEKSEVGREVTDEKEENNQYIDEEAKEEDNGEERQEEDQTGDSDLGEQFGERLARTEVDNIHQNQENKSQDDETQNDLDSVESMDNKDSDSTGCEDTCHSLERFKDEEQDLQTQHHENLQDHAELSLSNDNHISGARSSKRSNEGEDSETLTDAESQTNDEKESQEEEESNESDNEEEYSTDEDNNDEDAKIYSINHYHADIFHTLTQFKDSSLLTDLTLCTKGGKSFHVHSPVLAAVSSFIWAHLSRDTGKKDDDKNVGVQSWSVYLGPEVDHVGLGAIVEFAYTGLISCLNKDTVEQVKTAAQTLGVPRVLRLCTEADGASTKTGEQNKDGKILAEEQMMVSLQSIKQLWMDRIGCDVTLEALGESLHDKE
ncbi:hypothetical protein Q5P01_002466 [Channa striata]|uniref:BTB domain-containing protein n=1 Tax=Channa striata TaxID=64152 RepID=A0AA88NT97_CHASR|nr:hypothetical protein Q5P01_002466 [Channa striata]